MNFDVTKQQRSCRYREHEKCSSFSCYGQRQACRQSHSVSIVDSGSIFYGRKDGCLTEQKEGYKTPCTLTTVKKSQVA